MKVGIIGLGKMGQMRAALCQEAGIEIAGVCDLDPRLAANYPDIPFYSHYTSLLADRSIDAVFICVFNNVAPEIVSFSLCGNKHVFCEKPPGRNLQDMNTIKNTKHLCSSDLILMFGFDRRYQPHVIAAKKEIESGRLGRILWMRGAYGARGHSSHWRQIEMLSGGGISLDLGIHMIDLLRWLTDEEFTVVSSLIDCTQTSAPIDDNVFALLKSVRTGIHASIHLSATMDPSFFLEVGMAGGFVRMNGMNTPSTRYFPANIMVYTTDSQAPAVDTIARTFHQVPCDQSFRSEVAAFQKAVETGTIEKDAPTLTDAWEAMALIGEMHAAGRQE